MRMGCGINPITKQDFVKIVCRILKGTISLCVVGSPSPNSVKNSWNGFMKENLSSCQGIAIFFVNSQINIITRKFRKWLYFFLNHYRFLLLIPVFESWERRYPAKLPEFCSELWVSFLISHAIFTFLERPSMIPAKILKSEYNAGNAGCILPYLWQKSSLCL